MPPRKAARRIKKSSIPASTPVVQHELPAPEVQTETELADDLKVMETAHESPIQEPVSDPNRVGTDGVDFSSELITDCLVEDVNETMNEDDVVEEESENVDEEKQGEESAEIISAQEEMTAAQVDDKNNDVQDSDVSKSLCKTEEGLVVNTGDIKGTTEMVSMQESAQDVSTQTSRENNTALAVEDDSLEIMYDDESDDEIDDESEEDDADNEGGEDQDPSLIVQDSSCDNKKEKGTEIYVGKLDKNAVEDDLVSVFQQFGELKSTRIVRKPNTNKSKGFGFVRFASVDQAKRALSELKEGVEVRGKRVVISASEDNDTLHLGNICKTWKKEQVLQQLEIYGIEHIEVLRLPEDPKAEKNKGFAFLEFSSHSDAVAAFQRLKKPDVFFGRDISAKVAFAQTPLKSRDEDLSQVKEVHLEGLTEDWNEEKVNDICKEYGEVLKINLRPGKLNKRKDFGFVIFDSPESARACVDGINNTATGGEVKIKASIAKHQQKGQIQKQGFRGGFKAEKQSANSDKKSQPKSSKMKGVLNTQQTRINKKYPLKNKIKDNTIKGSLKKDGEGSRGDNDPQQRNRKRKAFSEQKSSARDQGTPKKPNNGGQGQNSQSVSRAGSHKRKNPSGNESRGDRGNRNAQGKKPFKKQKGNVHGKERENPRNPRIDTHTRRGHNDYINSTRYAPNYAASASNSYHVASEVRYKEMAPHAGYIEPAYAKQSGPYSRYIQPVVRTPHAQHQPVYLEPSSTSQSQVYSRYSDRPVMTQPYRDYHPPGNVQYGHDHYDPGLARVVRHDDRGAGVNPYVGGPRLQASQVPNHTGYYQGGGSYGGAYGGRGAYY